MIVVMLYITYIHNRFWKQHENLLFISNNNHHYLDGIYRTNCLQLNNSHVELHQLLAQWYEATKRYNPELTSTLLNTTDLNIPSLQTMAALATTLDRIRFYDRQYLERNKQHLTDTTKYQYNFIPHVPTIKQNMKYEVISFDIEEHLASISTKGGSTFHIVVEGPDTRGMCKYWDYFNGVYSVCCPVVSDTENVVKVVLMNVDFHSYKLHYSLHRLLSVLNFSTGSTDNNISEFSVITISSGVQIYNITLLGDFAMNTVYWQLFKTSQQTSSWVRKHSIGDSPKQMAADEITKCFKEKYTNIYFIGDSHIRYVYFYTKILLGMKVDTPKHTKVDSFENVHFQFVDYTVQLVTHLRNTFTELKTGDKVLLFISTGNWNMNYHTPTSYIKDVCGVITQLDKYMRKYNLTVIWQDMPPVPRSVEHVMGFNKKVKLSNSFMAAAVNDLIGYHLRHMGIHVVSIFGLARPFTEEDVCRGHYLCIKDSATVRGDVGLEAFQQLFRSVGC